MKVGTKRRRTRQEILDEKEEARLKQESIEEKLAMLDNLTAMNEDLMGKYDKNEGANVILKGLLDKGMVSIGENGVWSVNPNLQEPAQYDPEDMSQDTQEQQQPSAFMDEQK